MRNFANDLKRGQAGEHQFLTIFKALIGTDGRKGDIVTPDGNKIELKTDFYPMHKTKNFFIERYSSLEVHSPGGPWQAKQHGCKWFVYYYTADKTGFIFETDNLLTQLDKLESNLTPVHIKNRKWTTIGYKVDRSLLLYTCKFTTVSLEVLDATYSNIGDEWGFCQIITD